MELLAPAGSVEQANLAIKSGCDALYGGLNKWNARNRAENFSVSEYNLLMKTCKINNVKFYMTVNILLKDEEIDELIALFKSGMITFPDAFIVADIGVLLTLKKEFPNIPLHASTQFGAHTLADVKFLEELGVSRVVLARELTFNEIAYICKNTILEIEVFIYGSQCICFSGQCLWGGLLNGASGNRGRCIGMCRDLYCSSKEIGQIMYPRDIDASCILRKLESIGVASAKIEGRMRKPKEISNVLKNAYCTEDQNFKYIGYMGDDIPVKNMLSYVNPRTEYSYYSPSLLSENDLIIDKIGKYKFWNSIDNIDDENIKFVKSIITNPLKVNGQNISLRIIVEENDIMKIDFINTYGERKIFRLKSGKEESSIKDLYYWFNNKLEENIYEFSSNVPFNMKVVYSLDGLFDIIKEIKKTFLNFYEKGSKNEFHDGRKKIISVSNINKINKLLSTEVDMLIYRITSIDKLKKVLSEYGFEERIWYELPVLDFMLNEDEYFKILKNKNIVITRFSQIRFLKKYIYKNVLGSYTLNVWNTASIEYLKRNNINSFILSPELSFEYGLKLSENKKMNMYLLEGHIPIGYTRACFKELKLCDCISKNFILSNISKGYEICIICNNKLGYRTIIPKLKFKASLSNNYETNLIYMEYDEVNIDFENYEKLIYDNFVR